MSLHESLSALLAGDLPPEEAEALRRRIATEPEVAAAWRQMQQLCGLLDDLPLPDVPDALVDEVVPPRAPAAPRSGWPVAAAAAAGLVAGLGLGQLGAEGPASVRIGPEGVTVEGAAVVEAAGGRVSVDERAVFPLPEARIEGPVAPDPRGAPGSDAAPPSSEADAIAQLQLEIALLRGRLATHEGEPLPWPPDVPPVLRPEGFEPAARRAVAAVAVGELLAVDCAEYPCAVLLYARLGEGEDGDWAAALAPLHAEAGDGYEVVDAVRVEEVDGVRHAVAVLSVMQPERAALFETRLVFRARELIEEHQPDVMRRGGP